MLPFYSCGKAHVSATKPELFRSLSGIHVELFLNSSALPLECNGAQRCCHFIVVGRHTSVPPTPTCCCCGKAHCNATNPELFRSLLEFTLCFPRHSEAEWMLRTDLASQRHQSGCKGLTLPNNVNFFIWLGKSHFPRTNCGESSRRSSFSPQLLLVGQLVLVVRCICIRFEQLLLVSSSLLSCLSSLLFLGQLDATLAHTASTAVC